jgi:DNA polymerase-4
MAPAQSAILHVDMDAFYASVEQRDRPELRGRPVIVGGSAESRGVVCAASYEARKFGVHSAMPAITARRLCPQGIFLPVRMEHYARISEQIREIFLSFTPLVEALSLDEAFLDVRGCEGLFGSAPEIAHKIKTRVKEETGLVASVGVAPNKFLAKLASDLGKPDGFVVLHPEKVREALDPLPVGRIWGVGAKAEKRLHGLGVRTIGQLASFPVESLVQHFGEAGRHMWQLAHGQDDRLVVADEEAKSISTETTFAHDIGDLEVLRCCLLDLTDHLGQRIRRRGVRARMIELKVRNADFRTFLRSTTLHDPTDVTEVIWQAVLGLFQDRVADDWLPVRLLGVGCAGLVRDSAIQGQLFDDGWHEKHRALDQAMDAIRSQFGTKAIGRAGGLEPGP